MEKDKQAVSFLNEQDRITWNFYNAISIRLGNAMAVSKTPKQEDVVKKCKEAFGFDIDQGTISKILNYRDIAFSKRPPTFSLINVAYICKALNVHMNEIISTETSILDINSITPPPPADSKKRSAFVFNPNENEFKGYKGEYYCYFFPTISSEHKMLTGKLCFSDDNIHGNCRADFELNTNLKKPDGSNVFKHYTGTLIVSVPQNSCYCILSNSDYGEICMLNFHHRYFIADDQELRCRLAAVITTSAGESRRPTTHRMLISRTMLTAEEQSILSSQLLLNSADIIVPVDDVRAMIEQDILPSEIAALFEKEIKPREFYCFNEFKIHCVNLDYTKRAKAICQLREKSSALIYNKISSKADELIFKYLTQRNNNDTSDTD